MLKGQLDIRTLPMSVQQDIIEFYQENNREDPPVVLSVLEALDAYLLWNGIIDFTGAIHSIFEASQKPKTPH